MDVKPIELTSVGKGSSSFASLPGFSGDEDQTYSKEQLDALLQKTRQEGYDEGLQAGIQQGQGEKHAVEQQAAQALEMLVTKLDELTTQLQQIIEQRTKESVSLALIMAKKLTEKTLEEEAITTIENITRQCIEMIFDEKEIRIEVNEAIAGPLQEKITALANEKGFKGKVDVQGLPSINLPDYKIHWSNGGIEKEQEALWQEIDKIVAPLASDIPTTPKETAEETSAEIVEEAPAKEETETPTETTEETPSET